MLSGGLQCSSSFSSLSLSMWGISNSILFGLLLVVYQVISSLLAVIFISLLIFLLVVIFM
jgi:hypothetical protein